MITGIGTHKASSKLINTNGTPGFTRGRKYDTDLDRLGRMETAHGEMRKIGDLNKELREMQKEMRGNNIYSIKRFSVIREKTYGALQEVGGALGDGARDAAGNTLKGAGNLLDNGVAKTGGFVAGLGAMGTGASIGSAIGTAIAPGIGTAVGGALGGLATPFVTKDLVGGAGKALKSVGEDIKS